MKDLWIITLMAISLGSFIGCEASVETHSSKKEQQEKILHQADLSADLLPHTSITFYRIENDEVICYQGHDAMWCHWKGSSNDQH